MTEAGVWVDTTRTEDGDKGQSLGGYNWDRRW